MKETKSNADQVLFRNSLNTVPTCKRRMADTDWFPAVDASETGDEYLLEFDLPGIGREEIQMCLEGPEIRVTGVRTTLRHGRKRLRIERPAGAFVRRVVLPEDCRKNAIHATLHDGVLQLHIPKNTQQNQDQPATDPSESSRTKVYESNSR